MARTTGRLRTRGAASFGHDTEKWHCEFVVQLHLVTTLKSGTASGRLRTRGAASFGHDTEKWHGHTGRLRTRGAASFGHDTEKWHGLLEGCELVVLLHLVTTLKSGTDNWKVANSWCSFIWSRH